MPVSGWLTCETANQNASGQAIRTRTVVSAFNDGQRQKEDPPPKFTPISDRRTLDPYQKMDTVSDCMGLLHDSSPARMRSLPLAFRLQLRNNRFGKIHRRGMTTDVPGSYLSFFEYLIHCP